MTPIGNLSKPRAQVNTLRHYASFYLMKVSERKEASPKETTVIICLAEQKVCQVSEFRINASIDDKQEIAINTTTYDRG